MQLIRSMFSSWRRIANDRRGSTLVIVVALLGIMAFLGFVFYTFAKQERANALTFSQAAKDPKGLSVDAGTLFDAALEQIIVGPPDSYVQSIIWGGRHSLLANMFGRDAIPWNGEGVNLMQDSTGMPFVDMNFNGTVDPNDNQSLLCFVDSPAANSSVWSYGAGNTVWGTDPTTSYSKIFRGTATLNQAADIPEPDVNYNSPDINSLFLSYDGTTLNASAGSPTKVFIPSFFRPQYMRTAGTPATTTAQWYQNAPANQVMRPHPGHVCVGVDSSGNPIVTALKRYVASTEMDTSVTPNRPMYQSLKLRRPFTYNNFAPETAAGTGTAGYLGNWTATPNSVTVNGVTQYEYDLDVDTDGDGVPDAILMDLGYPPIRRGDGKLVVPLFAISIRDMNGLLNANATGNLYGNINLNDLSQNAAGSPPYINLGFRRTGGTFGGSSWTGATYNPDSLSKSNLGLSTYEINILRALTADPSFNITLNAYNDPSLISSSSASQLSYFLQMFDPSIQTATTPTPGRTITELANLEWLTLNIGRAGFQTGTASTATSVNQLRYAITNLYAGREAELPRLRTFLSSLAVTDTSKPGLSTTWSGGIPTNWPPIASTNPNPDDNLNVNEGERNQGEAVVTIGQTVFDTRWYTPLDFRGSGQIFQRSTFGPDGLPGVALTDDDANGVVDDFSEEGWTTSDDATGGTATYGKVPEFARYNANPPANPNAVTTATTSPYYSLMPLSPAPSPLSWPAYWGYHSFNGSANGGVRWGEQQTTRAYYAWLMQSSHSDSLLDDPTESIIDPTLQSSAYANYLNYLTTLTPTTNPANSLLPLTTAITAGVTNAVSNDAVFGPEENLLLQGTTADARTSDTRSRLADLMPGNLVASQNAPTIRKRLTTVSMDRREFGVGFSPIGGLRSWETSPEFPPYGASAVTYSAPAVADGNPYRAELFNYLLQQFNNSGSPSLKLNVNRWLYLDAVTGGNQYGFAPLPEQTSPTDINAAEARQKMARDIYTLLYTFCCVHTDGTNLDVDYRTVASTYIPTAAQTKEMAQFAVNLVDALDTDNIITAFFYDTNLSNNGQGWQTTSTGTADYLYGVDGIAGTADDNVVYGVERQLLTFSEASAFIVQPQTTDSNLTIFDDTQTGGTPAGVRQYLFLELQNVSPTYVVLASPTVTAATAATTADWRIRMVQPTSPLAQATTINTLYFLPGLNTTSNYLPTNPDGSTTPVLAPGGLFSVACQDGTDTVGGLPRTSDFRADPSLAGTSYPLCIPTTAHTADGIPDATITSSTSAASMVPKCNLDLAWTYPDGASRFSVVQGNPTTPGGFVSQLAAQYTSPPVAGKTVVRLVLERRAAAGPDVPNNFVWAPVDLTQNNLPSSSFTDVIIGNIQPPVNSAGAGAAATALTAFSSFPRTAPLLSGTATQVPGTNNTINAASTVTNSSINSTAWQLQNDRDFGSLSELLQLPLYGSGDLTSSLANVLTPTSALACPSLFHQTNASGTAAYVPTIAAARFLRPDNPDYTANGNTTTNYGNRWYRLLNLLEVPNRSHQHQAIVGIPPSGTLTISPAGNPNYGLPVQFTNPGTPGSTSYLYSPTAASSPTLTTFAGSFNLPQYFGWPRTHGLLNLNMIRDPQVLMALLDDDQQIKDPRYYAVGAVTPYLDSVDPTDTDTTSAGGVRKWWYEFLKSRDSRYVNHISGTPYAVDPVTNMYAPATANARPFRSIDSIGPLALNTTTMDSPLEYTVLRSLPMDSLTANNANESRRLFEIGNNTTDHYGPITTEATAPNPPLHPSARYRLMSKLLNNTTTRSNTFAIYIAVQFYEAVEVSSGGATVVRIGGKLDDTPSHRGFFVVDRTGAIDQMKTLEANVANGTITVSNPTFPVSPSSYSFQSNTDTTGTRTKMNGIRWRDLVLFRQTLN